MTKIRLGLSIFIFGLSLSVSARERLTFNQFLKLAQQQNLKIKAETAKTLAAQANAKTTNIPPPMVGYMKMTDRSGSADGFEVSQMIPFPTKITSNRLARKLKAQAQHEAGQAAESEVQAKARIIYFALWASQERIDILQKKKRIIEAHIRLTRAGVRSNSFLRVHLLKTESDLDLIENDLLAAGQNLREKEAAAAAFLNLDIASFHPEVTEPVLTPVPNRNATSNSHQIESAELSLESFKEQENVARSSWFPDLYLRYKQMGQTHMMPETSEFMVGLSLPFVFPWDVSANSEKASAERLQAEINLKREELKIGSEEAIMFSKAEALKEQIENINKRLLPRAEKRMRLVRNIAPRDMETLQEHRETMEALPDLKLKALDLRMNYEEAVARLMKYVWSESK